MNTTSESLLREFLVPAPVSQGRVPAKRALCLSVSTLKVDFHGDIIVIGRFLCHIIFCKAKQWCHNNKSPNKRCYKAETTKEIIFDLLCPPLSKVPPGKSFFWRSSEQLCRNGHAPYFPRPRFLLRNVDVHDRGLSACIHLLSYETSLRALLSPTCSNFRLRCSSEYRSLFSSAVKFVLQKHNCSLSHLCSAQSSTNE